MGMVLDKSQRWDNGQWPIVNCQLSTEEGERPEECVGTGEMINGQLSMVN